jgi:hypothetical protein
MRKKTELLKEVNDAIKKAKLSDLILRDTYLNVNILNVTEQTIKKALEDNMYHFKQDRRIRFQIFNPNKKYF